MPFLLRFGKSHDLYIFEKAITTEYIGKNILNFLEKIKILWLLKRFQRDTIVRKSVEIDYLLKKIRVKTTGLFFVLKCSLGTNHDSLL